MNRHAGEVESCAPGHGTLAGPPRQWTFDHEHRARPDYLRPSNYFGEGWLSSNARQLATVTAMTECTFERIEASAMWWALDSEPDFSRRLMEYLLRQNLRLQEDIIDLHFHSTEKRLARVLLQLADYCRCGNPQPIPIRVNQTVLASMISATRPRVSYFMNKFRRQGFIEYDRHGHVSVRNTLLSLLLES
jgi:CRP-like cAMP-binding protein